MSVKIGLMGFGSIGRKIFSESLKTNNIHYSSPHYSLVHVAHALKLEIFDLQSELNKLQRKQNNAT